MSSVFIDHKILRSYYNQDDIIVRNVYEKGITTLYYEHKNYIILHIQPSTEIITSFNIKSENICMGYVCVYQIIISSFIISEGSNEYPNLMLSHGNYTKLILDKYCVTEVKMSSVNSLKCDLIKNYCTNNNEYTHRIIKVNDFGPNVTYHTPQFCNYSHKCEHNVHCSFDNVDNIYYVDDESNLENIDPLINHTKINEIVRRVSQLLNCDHHLINDLILHICIIMYNII